MKISAGLQTASVIICKCIRQIRRKEVQMGLFDDVLKGNIVTGLAIGIGAAVLAPAVLPVIAGVAKPVAKAAIKG